MSIPRLFFFLTFLVSLPAGADIGTDWLAAQRNADGAYALTSDVSTPYQSTAEALRAASALGTLNQLDTDAALDYLDAESYQGTEYLARRIIAWSDSGRDVSALLQQLAGYQAVWGGFGDLSGYEATVLDTAFALLALSVSGDPGGEIVTQAVGHLLQEQNPDGGWSWVGENVSSVYPTALALEALAGYRDRYDLAISLSAGRDFLLAARDAGQTWGETHLSASSLLALTAFMDDFSDIAASLAALRSAQGSDGSWDGDVYTTALALRALHQAESPPEFDDDGGSGNPGLARIFGTVVDGQSGAPLADVTLDLVGPDQLQQVTGADGQFDFRDLIAGDYNLTLTAPGYLGLSGGTSAQPGQAIDFGVLRLVRSGETQGAIVQGLIRDRSTGMPLPGATVTVTGAANAQAFTGVDGNYQFNALPSGTVTIEATKNGYSTASAGANLFDGGLFVFSASVVPTIEQVTAVEGRVTDRDTGAALPGVEILVAGAAQGSAFTDADGLYSVAGLSPGEITISASKSGYHTLVATANMYTNNILDFSPEMFPVTAPPPTGVGRALAGIVVDAVTESPLPDVSVTATFGTDTRSQLTDLDGRFYFDQVEVDSASLEIGSTGFQQESFSVPIHAVGLTDIGQIALREVDLLALLPDLVVESIDTSTAVSDPGALLVRGSLTGWIANPGTSSAPAGIRVLAFYDANDDGAFEPTLDTPLGSALTGDEIPVGQHLSLAVQVAGTLPYRDAPISLWVDSDQSLVELNDQNNVSISNADCTLPDLTLGYLSVTEQGTGGLRFGARVGNAGTQTFSAGSQVRFFEGDPDAGGALLGNLDLETVEANRYKDLFLEHVTGLQGGLPIHVLVDPSEAVDECSEANNRASLPAPDLKPDLVVVDLDPSGLIYNLFSLEVSGNLAGEVVNQGSAPSTGPVDVLVYYDQDGDSAYGAAADLAMGIAHLEGELAIGASRKVRVPVSGIVPFRDAPLSLWVDSAQNIVELDEDNNRLSVFSQCRRPTVQRAYTLNADFDEGESINVVTDIPDQLQLDDTARAVPFIWIPASGRGTILKLDIDTGKILGEFLSAPNGRGRNPSRTTVDKGGNVWAGNRDEASGGRGSVVQVGLEENGQCVDRNGNGVIDTSRGLGDILPWSNPGGVDNNGGVSSAQDECIIKYVRVGGDYVRHVSVDENNDVWAAGNFGSDNRFNLIENATGNILSSFDVGCGGYGGLVDGNGVIWSSNRGPGSVRLLRYNTRRTLTRDDDSWQCLPRSNSYGVGIDSAGNIWNSQYTWNRVYKYSPAGTLIGNYPSGGASYDRGVAVTADDHVWVANSGGSSVSRLDNNGALVAVIGVGRQPTGVSVDTNGKVWSANRSSSTASRIDPVTNETDLTVDLGSNAAPYNYGDMTGSVLLGAPDTGTWTVVYDAGDAETRWGEISWNALVLGDGKLEVTAAVSVDGTSYGQSQPVANGEFADLGRGRYIKISVRFQRASSGESPILYDLGVASVAEAVPDLTAALLTVIDNGSGQPSDLQVRIGNAGALTSPQGAELALYQGDPDDGGLLLGTLALDALVPGAWLDAELGGVALGDPQADIHALADPQDQLQECNELNNRVQTPVPASTRGRIQVATDAPDYPPNSPVLLQAVVVNAGAVSGQFSARLHLEDAGGFLVDEFPTRDLGTLDGGAQIAFNESWSTALTLAGTYTLVGQVFGADGLLQDTDRAEFRIAHPNAAGPEVSLRTTTDRPRYHTTDNVNIANLVRNLTDSTLIDNASLRVTVVAPDGQQLYQTRVDLGQLPPGSTRERVTPYVLHDVPIGAYQARGEVLDGTDQVLTSDDASFDVVQDVSRAVSGAVTAQFPQRYIGQEQICTDRITNNGNLDIDNLSIRRLLTRLDDPEQITDLTRQISLPASGTQTLVRVVPTDALVAGDYACVLQALYGKEWTTLDFATFRVDLPPIGAELALGSRGRVLILLDEPGRTCSGVESLDLEAQWGVALSDNATVSVRLYDEQATLVDEEDAAVNTQGVDGNEGAGANLVITDSAPHHLALRLVPTAANDLLGASYRVEATASDGASVASALIPTDCEPLIKIGETWGEFSVTELALRPAANDPLGPNHIPDLVTQRAYLESLLTEAGWSYTITTNADDFTARLRSGEYLTYLLLSEHVKLDESVQKELREAIYREEGLIEAGSHDQRQGRIDEALGVIFRGKLSHVSGVELIDSPVHAAGSALFGLSDRQLRVALGTAESLGHFLDTNGALTPDSAVTRADYGQGRSVYMGFDLLAEASLLATLDNLYATLALGALEHVYPAGAGLRAGGVYPLTLTLKNRGIATPGRVMLDLPAGVEMIDANGALLVTAAANTPQQWQWLFALDEGQVLTHTAWVKLPAGTHTLSARIDSGTEPSWVQQAEVSLELSTEAAPDLAATLAHAQALGNSYKQVAKYLGWAQEAVTAGEYEAGLGDLVRAGDAAADVETAEADALRLDIARIIRAVGIALLAPP